MPSNPIGGPAHNIEDATLVYHINLLLLAVVGTCALIRLPRTIALFGTPREWLDGYFLYHSSEQRTRQFVQASCDSYPPPSTSSASLSLRSRRDLAGIGAKDSKDIDSDTWSTYSSEYDHDYYAYPDTTYYSAYRLSSSGTPLDVHYPPHIGAWPKPLRRLAAPLRTRIAPGFSLVQFLVLCVYCSPLLYATFLGSNIITDNSRTGWIAVGQMVFVYAFAQKNNLLGGLVGCGYEKINFVHRFAGRIAVLASNIHSFHYFYRWTLEGTFKQNMANLHRIMGVLALICMDVLFLFSVQFVRTKAYNLFLRSHMLCLALVLPATYFHKPPTLPYILTCVALYTSDRLMRLLKTRISTARVQALPELDATRVVVPHINAGWRAGQHVRLRVLSGKMGWSGCLESHPFTIASVSRCGGEEDEGAGEGVVLVCKRAGDWTGKLYDFAKEGVGARMSFVEGANPVSKSVKVALEGPYGGPKHTNFASFSAAVFIVGGSGISYALSAIRDLVEKDLEGESRVKIVELVWSVPEPKAVVPVLDVLKELLGRSVCMPIRISVFWTRAPVGVQPVFRNWGDPVEEVDPMPLELGHGRIGGGRGKEKASGKQDKYREKEKTGPVTRRAPRTPTIVPLQLPPSTTLAPGRPKYAKIMEGAIQRAVMLGSGPKDDEKISGMVVSVCGPVEMADDVCLAVGGVEARRREQVGGVEVVEEVFGW